MATGPSTFSVDLALSIFIFSAGSNRNIHPQSGYEHIFGVADEDIIAGGGRVGIVCTAPATVNVIPWIKCEE